MDVELVYDRDCPNIGAARAELLRAFVSAGVPPRWTEWTKDDPAAPAHVEGWPSPTVLVDRRDVLGGSPAPGACCRIDGRGEPGVMRGVPDSDRITEVLRNAASAPPASPGRRTIVSLLGPVPGILLVLLPKVACPACWPLYAGLLGSIGLGFLLREEILLPLTAVFLVLALGALGVGARRRRGYGPLVVGAVAALGLLIGKFVLELEIATPLGVSVLVAASIWNAWPRPRAAGCGACTSSVNQERNSP